jgi:translation initiation factor 1
LTTGAAERRGGRVAGKLGDLLKGAGVNVSDAPKTPPPPPSGAATAAIDFGGAKKLVVRRERKGRGGKTATVVEGIRVSPSALDRIARELRRALGCGAGVEDGCVVVQGDQADRVERWLVEHGAPKVVIGN